MASKSKPGGAGTVDRPSDDSDEVTTYNAFISYSRRDSLAATGIQKALHRIGRRPGRLYALRVFRDSTDLVASPDLWGRVREAIDRSGYLIVLLSPAAAASDWVNKEVLHWIQTRGLERLLLVLVGGRLEWDAATGRFHPERSDAAVAALTVEGSLPTEPIYVDISQDEPWDPNSAAFRDKIIDLAAPIHGKTKYELASDDVREQRRYRRLRRLAVAALALLTVVAVVTAAMAFVSRQDAIAQRQLADQQREEAVHQRNEAEVRRILGDADAILAGNRGGGDVRAFQELLAANAVSPDTAAGGLLDAAIRRTTTRKIISLPGERESAMAISPKADWIVTGGYDGAVRLRDARSGQSTATVAEPVPGDDLAPQVRGVVVSPDGTWFAAAQYDGTIRLWDSRSHDLLTTIKADNILESIAVSSDGRQLVSASGETVQVWDTPSGSSNRDFVVDPDARRARGATALALSRDGNRVAAATLQGVMLWDGGGVSIGFQPTPEIVNAVGFSPDGRQLASGENNGDIRIWDARTGAPRGVLVNARTRVGAVTFSADGRRLFTAGDDGVVRIWDAGTGLPLGELTGHTSAVTGLAFNADGTVLASDGTDETVRLWNPNGGQFPVLDADSEEVQAVAYSRDCKRLATGGNDNVARIWDPTTGALLKTIKAGDEGQPIINLALSPDGRQLATVGNFNSVMLWNVETGKLDHDLRGHDNQTMAVVYSPDGRMLVSGDIDGRIALWDPTEGTLRGNAPALSAPITSLVFSPDGKRLAGAGEQDAVRLWNLAEGRVDKDLLAYGGVSVGLAFSADGQLVASAGPEDTVRVWNINSGKLIQTLTGHNGSVMGVAFSPTTPAILASTGADDAVRLWNVDTGQPVGAPMTGHTGQVRAVAFSPDGKLVASGGADGKVRFWLAGATPEMFCDKIIYNMNEEQWKQWISPDIAFQPELCKGLPAWPE